MPARRPPPPAPQPPGWTIHGELQVTNDATLAPRDAFAQHFVLEADRRPTRRASAIGVRMATGEVASTMHRHPEAQLLCPVRGDLTCEAAGAWWIVPPGSALWVPSNVDHRIRCRAPLEGYNLFLDPDAVHQLPATCCAVAVTPLFREIIARLGTHPMQYDVHGPGARLVAVLLDELALLPVDNHRLPMPSDPRLQRLVAMITANPADGADLPTWARRVGVAERTLNRLLVQQTGLSFGRWRQQLHIVLAIQHLARGATVQRVAGDLGYETASSFVTMFRKALGKSPARYMAERHAMPRR